MSTAEPSFSWGADVGRRGGSSSGPRARSRRRTLLYLRAEAVLIDGLLLLVPVLGAAALLSALFPHEGFFLVHRETATGAQRVETTIGAPGLLLITALTLSYFYICEAACGQTFGKRRRGLRVRAAGGGQAGCNGISARTVLRLLDGLLFYAVGALVAVCSGRRRRRIGDWAGGTVVVIDDGSVPVHRRPELWRLAVYPAAWIALTVIASAALGSAVSEREAAIALVRTYVQAREHGDAQRACSMLTVGQQRELATIQGGGSYGSAGPGDCPRFILTEDARSHLLNPALGGFTRSALLVASSPLGVYAVYSREDPGFALIAVREDGRLKLDMRGLERAEFVRACSAPGTIGPAVCACTFDRARAEGRLPEGPIAAQEVALLRADARRCGAPATAFHAGLSG